MRRRPAVVLFHFLFSISAPAEIVGLHIPGMIESITRAVQPKGNKALQGICSAPVATICGGDDAKAARAKFERAFGASTLGSALRENKELPKLAKRVPSLGSGFAKREVDDTWAELYVDYASAQYRALPPEAIPDAKAIAALKARLAEALSAPGYRKKLGRDSDEKDKEPGYLKQLKSVEIIAGPQDFERVVRKLRADKRLDTLRGLMKHYQGACDEAGYSDNAYNFASQFVVICPMKLARTAYLRSQHSEVKDPLFGLAETLYHELGHNLDGGPGHAEMHECLHRHHPAPGSDKAPLLLSAEYSHYHSEIGADYYVAFRVRELIQQHPEKALELLQLEMGPTCDQHGTQFEFLPDDSGGTRIAAQRGFREKTPTHPRGDFRVEFIVRQGFVQEAAGCPARKPTRQNPPGCGFQGASPPGKY